MQITYHDRFQPSTVNFNYSPTIIEADFRYANGYDTLFGLCMETRYNYFEIIWNGVQAIDVYLAAGKYPLGHQKFQVNDAMTVVQVNIMELSRFDLGSDHLDRYPDDWDCPEITYYEDNFCLDRCIQKAFVDDKNIECSPLYERLLAQMNAICQPEWETVLQNELCRNDSGFFVYPHYKLCGLAVPNGLGVFDCYTQYRNKTSIEVRKKCQAMCQARRFTDLFTYKFFDMDNEQAKSQEFQIKEGITHIWLQNQEIKKVTTKLVPEIDIGEGIGLVGGYLGLFVGASVITLFEFLQFLGKLIYRKIGRD